MIRHSDEELKAIAKEIIDFKDAIIKKHNISMLDLRRLAVFMQSRVAQHIPEVSNTDLKESNFDSGRVK